MRNSARRGTSNFASLLIRVGYASTLPAYWLMSRIGLDLNELELWTLAFSLSAVAGVFDISRRIDARPC